MPVKVNDVFIDLLATMQFSPQIFPGHDSEAATGATLALLDQVTPDPVHNKRVPRLGCVLSREQRAADYAVHLDNAVWGKHTPPRPPSAVRK